MNLKRNLQQIMKKIPHLLRCGRNFPWLRARKDYGIILYEKNRTDVR